MKFPRQLAKIASHCDTTGTRFALNAVFLERDADGRPFAIATDGRRLVSASWIEDERAADDIPANCMIPGPALVKTAATNKPGKRSRCKAAQFIDITAAGPNCVTLATTDGETKTATEQRLVEGRFPKWRDVMPAIGADWMRVKLDPEFFADIAAMLPDDKENRGIELAIGPDHGRPVVWNWRGADGVELCGAIAPMATDEKRENRQLAPAWYPAAVETFPNELIEEARELAESVIGADKIFCQLGQLIGEWSFRKGSVIPSGPAARAMLAQAADIVAQAAAAEFWRLKTEAAAELAPVVESTEEAGEWRIVPAPVVALTGPDSLAESIQAAAVENQRRMDENRAALQAEDENRASELAERRPGSAPVALSDEWAQLANF